MATLQKVAIAGGSGNIGTVAVKHLIASGFDVTALQRPLSTATFPEGVGIKRVVYDSFDSWREALEGQDVVISFLVPPATEWQNLAADAAVAAKVKRFIPSEWGMNTTILGNTIFSRLLSDKKATQDHLRRLSEENEFFSWTGISTGLWFDWKHRTAEIADSGNEKFQVTNLSFIAKVIAKVLRNPNETANRYIRIASFNISQNEILALADEISDEQWTPKVYKVAEAQKTAEHALSIGDFDSAFYPLLHGRLLRDGAGLALKPGENFATEVLGLLDEEPADAIGAWLGT